MKTSNIDIDYLANLARIDLSKEEKIKLSSQLNDIIVYFDKLRSIDVDGVEPMAHAHKVFNIWREGDEPGQTYAANTLEKMAPEYLNNQVIVPKVVE